MHTEGLTIGSETVSFYIQIFLKFLLAVGKDLMYLLGLANIS